MGGGGDRRQIPNKTTSRNQKTSQSHPIAPKNRYEAYTFLGRVQNGTKWNGTAKIGPSWWSATGEPPGYGGMGGREDARGTDRGAWCALSPSPRGQVEDACPRSIPPPLNRSPNSERCGAPPRGPFVIYEYSPMSALMRDGGSPCACWEIRKKGQTARTVCSSLLSPVPFPISAFTRRGLLPG